MITALQDNFVESGRARDENSRAYVTVLRGVDPETSMNSHAHVASRLLAMCFLDICKGLDKDVEMKSEGEDVTRKHPGLALKIYNVFPISQLLQFLVG